MKKQSYNTSVILEDIAMSKSSRDILYNTEKSVGTVYNSAKKHKRSIYDTINRTTDCFNFV